MLKFFLWDGQGIAQVWAGRCLEISFDFHEIRNFVSEIIWVWSWTRQGIVQLWAGKGLETGFDFHEIRNFVSEMIQIWSRTLQGADR